MEFEGRTVPQEICAALADRVDRMDTPAILDYAKHANIKGIRPIPKNADKFRQRFKSRILKCGKVSGSLKEFLELLVLTTGCFGVLSIQAIIKFADQWLAFFGEADTLGCWLFDERDEIRQLALRRAAGFPSAKLPSKETAFEELKSIFKGFLNEIAPLTAEVMPEAPSAPAPEEKLPADAVHGAELKDLREKAARSRGLQQKLDRSNNRGQALEEQLQSLRRELDELKTQQRVWQKANKNLEEALRDERARLQQEISAALASHLEAEENRWLRELRQAETKFRLPDNADLMEKIEAVLQRQTEIDSACGNRAELEAELQRLMDAHRRIRQTRLAALNPLNELSVLEEELERRIDTINQTLENQPDIEIPQQFLKEVGAARTLDDINVCRRKIRNVAELGFLNRPAMGALEEFLHKREMMIYLKALGPRDIIEPGLQGIDRLLAQIKKGEPFKVWLDGHNIIKGLDHFREMSADGRRHKELRDELIRLLLDPARRNPKGEWVLVFDGEYPSDEERKADNLRVSYSGGGDEEHKADKMIIGEISWEFGQSSALDRYLFTNDKDFGEEAAKMSVAVLKLHDLELLLGLA